MGKRQRTRLGMLGALAMGLSAMAGTAEGTNLKDATPVQQSSNQSKSKVNTISQNVIEAKQVGKIGGTNMFAGYGIPPKIYGMHYVKRGTHKRTNKKR